MLIEQIKENQIQARKNRDAELTQLLTTLYSEAAIVGKNAGGRDTTDEEVLSVVQKFIKNAREVRNNLQPADVRYQDAGYEINILSQYLPVQLSEQELHVAIEAIIQAKDLSTMKDMGIVMKELKGAFDGQYDGKTASQFIKELLK